MIIFGSRRRKMVIGRMQSPCPRCRQLSFHTVERTQGQLTLFFVPMAPLPGGTVSRCEICGHRAPVDPLMAPHFGSLPNAIGMQGQMYGTPPLQGQAMSFPTQSPFVGVGPRLVATLLDMGILFIFLVIISLVFSKIPEGAALLLLVGIIAYYIVMEAIWGATLGKMALKLRIVHLDGSAIGWSEALIRTLLRMVDGLFCYLLAAIIISNSSRHQRLGDMVAKTVVIRR
jgi:uncharacterized RDD family membrane protein YckC